MEIAVLNSKFEQSSKLSTSKDLSPEAISVAVVQQVVNAVRAKRRQGTASVKTRAFVSGGGKKPFKQKGTGRARQGTSRAPSMVGGAVVHGPRPRDYTQKVNKKVMAKAVQSIIADKLHAGKLTVIERLESTGKTKDMFLALNSRNLLPALVVVSKDNKNALRATKNLALAKALAVEGFALYEAVKYENLIIEKEALEVLLNRVV